MYTHYNGILTVPADVVMEVAGISINTYSSYCKRGHLEVVRRGCNSKPALIKHATMAQHIKEAVVKKLGKPEDAPKYEGFVKSIGIDPKAVEYFTNHPLVVAGNIKPDVMRAYIASANVLAAIHTSVTKSIAVRAGNGKKLRANYWRDMAAAVKSVYNTTDLPHDLPSHPRKLREAYLLYAQEGFESLISARYGNQNRLKVDEKVEKLLLSIYTMKNKPFMVDAFSLINLFFAGQLDVADTETGEQLNPADFYKNGQPITISESTVKNWITKFDNRAVVDKKRMGAKRFNDVHRAHAQRKAPKYSLSKFSLDDRELSRPYKNAKGETVRVSQYLAYDVHSGAIVGYAHSKSKDATLFEDCIRSLFTTLGANNLPSAMEVEVEHHIVNQYFVRLRSLGLEVTECAPGNSQQKRAEHLNRTFKYGTERKLHGQQVGRFYGKHEAYQFDRDWVDNELVEKTHNYDTLVADAIHAIGVYNNTPVAKLGGLTRWQAFTMHTNPDAPQISWPLVAKCFGQKTDTSLARNYRLQVQHATYYVRPDMLNRFAPGNKFVQAYYLRNADGDIPNVYVYQGDKFIGECPRIERYQEAKVERTAADYAILGKQTARVKALDAFVANRVEGLMPVITPDKVEVPTTVRTVPQVSTINQPDNTDFEALLAEAEKNKAEIKRQAIERL